MIVAFCGHSTIANKEEVNDWIYSVTEQLILSGETVFYLGGYGDFDMAVKSVLNRHKKRYSYIEIVLILAYLNRSIDESGYCYTLYPPIETVPKRFAILKRNKWIVEQADIVVAYVTHGFGGAAKTLDFAQKKGKKIVLYSEDKEVN